MNGNKKMANKIKSNNIIIYSSFNFHDEIINFFNSIEHLEFFKLLTMIVIVKKNIVIIRNGKQKTS